MLLKANVHKIRNDLRRKLCNNLAMMAGNPSGCFQQKNVKDVLYTGGLGRRALARWYYSRFCKV